MKKISPKRKLIQQCALELFRENGYERTSIAQICLAAGVAEGTFYYHFSNKDALVKTLITDPFAMNDAALAELIDCDTHFERLLAIIYTSVSTALKVGPDIMRAYFRVLLGKSTQEQSGPSEQSIGPYNKMQSAIIRAITKAQEASEARNQSSPRQLATLVDRIIMGAYMNWAFMGGNYDLKKALRLKFEVLLDVRDDLRIESTRREE